MYPAEFLTVMHSSNEEEFKLTSSDSDRFLVLYRLRQMRDENVITQDVYKANQERLEIGITKDGTRQGLTNLLRSPILSKAIAQALQHHHIRPGFNAGTWGKKLIKGRFYQVSEPLETYRASVLTKHISNVACGLLDRGDGRAVLSPSR